MHGHSAGLCLPYTTTSGTASDGLPPDWQRCAVQATTTTSATTAPRGANMLHGGKWTVADRSDSSVTIQCDLVAGTPISCIKRTFTGATRAADAVACVRVVTEVRLRLRLPRHVLVLCLPTPWV